MPYSDEVLRDQTVSVLLVYKDRTCQAKSNVNIRGKSTCVELPDQKELAAVLLNSTLVGYGLFRLDAVSAMWFFYNLEAIIDHLQVSEIESLLNQIWYLYKCRLLRVDTLESVFNKLKGLTSCQILANIDYNWTIALQTWVPMDWYPEVNRVLANFYLSFIESELFYRLAVKCFTHFVNDEANTQLAV